MTGRYVGYHDLWKKDSDGRYFFQKTKGLALQPREYDMTDDSNNGNEKAIRKVVKKHVSDVFGEEEKAPEPEYPGQRYGGFSTQTTYDRWKQDNPGFAFQRAGQDTKTNATAAAWGKPRDTAMRAEYNEVGDPSGVNFTPEGWKGLRDKLFRSILRELDWERVVLMPDDHVILEQALDTVMRRGRFQIGREGSYYSYGTLRQVPITVGDDPPADPKALPASSMDLKDDGWGQPGDEEVIDVKGGDNE